MREEAAWLATIILTLEPKKTSAPASMEIVLVPASYPALNVVKDYREEPVPFSTVR